MAASGNEFDPAIIERHVESLLRKSSAFLVGSVVLGVILGATFGAIPFTSLADWPIPREFGFGTMLLGGIFGGIVGYVVGDTRSFMYKLQAQIALAQVKAARDSEAVLNLLRGVAAVSKPAPARPAPAQAAAAPAPEPELPSVTKAEPQLSPPPRLAAVAETTSFEPQPLVPPPVSG